MNTVVINIAKDFSRYPAGRYKSDGPYSGERFRDEFLIPNLVKMDTEVLVQLDGARGLASSFLEEAFGGLLRHGISVDALSRLKMESKDASLIHEINSYLGL